MGMHGPYPSCVSTSSRMLQRRFGSPARSGILWISALEQDTHHCPLHTGQQAPPGLMPQEYSLHHSAGAWWAFGCSHGGEVVCVDGVTGSAVWRADLPGRCDAGLAVTHDLRYSAGYIVTN